MYVCKIDIIFCIIRMYVNVCFEFELGKKEICDGLFNFRDKIYLCIQVAHG